MKSKFLSLAIVSFSTITFSQLDLGPVQAQTRGFSCVISDGIPTTVAQTARGNVPVIKWVSKEFEGAGWTAKRRCQEVSDRFQKFHASRELDFITTGKMNGQQVVCVTDKNGNDCRGLLLTIRPTSTPSETLQKLMGIRVGATGPAFESSGDRLYINMAEYLNQIEKSDSYLW
jgi:hypothetical protein